MGDARLPGRALATRFRVCALSALSLLVAAAGCGEDGSAGRAQPVLDCVRDAGAAVKKSRLFSFPGAAIESYQVTLKSGSFAGVEVFRSVRDAEQRLVSGPVSVRKGRTVVIYPGSSEADAALLEGCLASSVNGGGLQRGDLARQMRRREKRARSQSARYRNRSYATPTAISDVLGRLAGYDRYRLYYPGRRVGSLSLRAVFSSLQPPAYKARTKRIPAPTSPRFGFTYGTCKPPPGTTEGGCSPPLQVQNFEICAVNPNSYGLRPAQLTRRIRGVPVLTKDRPSSVELFTGHTTISISARSWELAARAIANLRSFDGRIGPNGKLPPPTAGALDGRLRCSRPTERELRDTP